MAWLGTWAHRRKITISTTNVDADLTQFPVLVKLGTSVGTGTDDVSDIFDEVADNNLKIAFTQADGTTQLYGEIENWSDAAETAQVWVSGSGWVIDDAVDTEIYMYFDAAQADNSTYIGVKNSAAAQSVWDSSYVGVYHMDDGANTSGIYDSTASNRDGTKVGAANPAVNTGGAIGNCQSFDGSDYINLGTGWSPTEDFTLQAIVKPTSATTADLQIISKGYDGTNTQFEMKPTTTDGKPHFQCWTGSGHGVASNVVMSTSVFKVYHATESTTNWNIFCNGVDKQTSTDDQGPIATVRNLLIGAVQTGASSYSQYWSGLIDEVRLSNGVRADAWIKADYYSMFDLLVDWSVTEDMAVGTLSVSVFDSITTAETTTGKIPTLRIDAHDDLTAAETTTVKTRLCIGIFDSVTVSDTTNDVYDSITVQDVPTVEIGGAASLSVNVYDSATVAETTATKIPTLHISVYDSATVAETITPKIPILRVSVYDTPTVAETTLSKIPIIHVSVYDSAGVSESITRNIPTIHTSVFDSASVSEDTVGEIPAPEYVEASVYDSQTVAETILTKIPTLHVSAFNSVTAAESVTVRIPTLHISVYDLVGESESTTAGSPKTFISVYDSVTETENINLFGSTGPGDISVFDLAYITEGVTGKIPTLHENVYDLIAGAESVTVKTSALLVNIYDLVATAEAATVRIPTLLINVYDSGSAAETITAKIPTLHINIYDTAGVAEDITLSGATAAGNLSVFDPVYVSEGVTGKIPALHVNIYDSVATQDIPTVTLGAMPDLNLGIFDSAKVSEQITASTFDSTLNASLEDNVEVSESMVGSIPVLYISVYDSIAATEWLGNWSSVLYIFVYDVIGGEPYKFIFDNKGMLMQIDKDFYMRI